MKRITHPTLTLVLLLILTAASTVAQDGQLKTRSENAEGEEATEEIVEQSGLVLPPGTQIPLELLNTINSRNSRAGDSVYFETLYPVVYGGHIVIPAGSYVKGSVARVKRPGRVKGRAELHIRIDELTLPNGYTVDIAASMGNAGTYGNQEVDRTEGGIKGEGSKAEDANTIIIASGAGASAGAIARGTRGGVRGGAAIGAAVGLATVLLTRGKELILERGTFIEIELDRPLPLDDALLDFVWTDAPPARRYRR